MSQPRVIPVIVVIQPRVLLLDVAGPIEVLRKANLIQSEVRFDVSFAGPADHCGSSIGLHLAGLAALPEYVPDNAFVVVSGDTDEPLGRQNARADDDEHQSAIVRWLRKSVRPGTTLVSICNGSLLAARAGLFDGYACTTHHDSMEELERLAPLANVLANRLFVEDRERLSSAGITAGIDLMLHVVAKTVGHACSLAVARYMVVYIRRGPSDPQLSPWLEGRNHIHPAVHRIQDAIAADPARDWSVDALAKLAMVSPRSLSRLFNEHTGVSVVEFVNRMRINLAGEMLRSSRLDMEAVAERAGFASTRQLRRAWSRYHDAPPSRMRG